MVSSMFKVKIIFNQWCQSEKKLSFFLNRSCRLERTKGNDLKNLQKIIKTEDKNIIEKKIADISRKLTILSAPKAKEDNGVKERNWLNKGTKISAQVTPH